MNKISAYNLVVSTTAICLGLAAVGGFGSAVSCELANGDDCGEHWKAGGAGALAAATTGGTLLARLERPEREEENGQPDKQ